jgi:HSP20 family protein
MPFNRLASLFDRLISEEEMFGPPRMPALPMAMWEDEAKVHVELDAPGLTEKEVELSVVDGGLVIRWERRSEKKEGGLDTRVYGRFEERVMLPAEVDPMKVEARLAGGVLRVELPKAPGAVPHRIAVKGE